MLLDCSNSDTRPVLVVEDCVDTVVVAATLAKVRNRLVRATNAEEALGLLVRSPTGSFAFMLLDYNLPGVDGLVFLEQLRRVGLLVDMPAVVLTTSVNPRDRQCFGEAGASAFHVKNVAYTECLGMLESIFEQWLRMTPFVNGVGSPPIRHGSA